jgi:hypothetical protein
MGISWADALFFFGKTPEQSAADINFWNEINILMFSFEGKDSMILILILIH